MKKLAIAAAALSGLAVPAASQLRPAGLVVPANTDVTVMLAEPISSKQARVGQRFGVIVTRDVVVNGAVAIPRGTRGWGEVAWRTGRGVYGKSGKVEIALRSLDVNGQAVPLLGRLREEGDGNTAATIGVALVAGLLPAAFVTGHSAVIREGRELHATTTQLATLTSAPIVSVAYGPVRPMVMAVAAPVPVLGASIAARTPYERALAAQRGVHGREPRQGWSISD